MWSRPNENHAIIDTHILKWLKAQGVSNVPKATPTAKNYTRLEQEFLSRVPDGMTPAEFDLQIWKSYVK
jgi:thermostable 8-oxoguanine DNA glycosylase